MNNELTEFLKMLFNSEFNKKEYEKFLFKMFKTANFNEKFDYNGSYIKERFREDIKSYSRIGTYTDSNKKSVDFLLVNLINKNKLEKSRTMQKNFISWFLNNGRNNNGVDNLKDSALVVFYTDKDLSTWRLSFVEMQYKYDEQKNKIKQEFTPAKRFSFLVGENEAVHTCCERFNEFFKNRNKQLLSSDPTIEEIKEIFNVEKVTDEFYNKYKELYIKLLNELKLFIKNDKIIDNDFKEKNISEELFCKKILGQIVFLYFIQKKGWLGVDKNQYFGMGDKQFLRTIFNEAEKENKNFFNDYLEPLFYEALAKKNKDDYFELLNCKIPFLNGGLFEPIKNYDYKKTNIEFDNKLFSNNNKTKEGDIGDGILDIFDRYNFTIYENEPLETEIAIDPEMLGKIFESMLDVDDRKSKGAFYTPKEIIQYMCQESLINYLNTKFPEIEKTNLENFIKYGEQFRENEKITLQKQENIKNKEQKTTDYENKISQDIIINKAKEIDESLINIKVCDPAIGSGAFPVGIMNEIVRARLNLIPYIKNENYNKEENENKYNFKLQAIQNSIYGVDIEDSAVEIAKLRFWLSLIIEEDNKEIKTMPNLDYKIVCGNSLLIDEEKKISIQYDIFGNKLNSGVQKELDFSTYGLKNELIEKLDLFTNISDDNEKSNLKSRIEELINFFKESKVNYDCFEIYFPSIFFNKNDNEKGFDIIIGNPPYVSNKGIGNMKETYKKIYGLSDDLYNYFFVKSDFLLKENGILCLITSNTFLTIESKKNIREQIQNNHLLNFVNLGSGIFDSAVVDTVITIYKKENLKDNYKFNYIDVEEEQKNNENFDKTDFYKFIGHKSNIDIFKNALNKVFFTPNEYNMKIYNIYNDKVKELYNKYWDFIKDAKSISKNQDILNNYRNSLKEGDITLLGLITDGGQGLATANNGYYIACLDGTKWANKIKEERWKKLKDACEKDKKIINYLNINNINYKDFLNSKSEQEIENLFDDLKEKFGRDIFGQGYLFKIVKKEQIANVEELTEDEKTNGIEETKPTYVPYDKGDKDGNRWYLETPYYINWSKKNVHKLQTDKKARWQGYMFYFKEGFTYPLLGIYLKSRTKIKSINDVSVIAFSSILEKISNFYIVSLLNCSFIYKYLKRFLNNSVNITLSPRLLPIIIPTKKQLKEIENIVNQFIQNKKDEYKNGLNKELEKYNNELQNELNNIVENMYLK